MVISFVVRWQEEERTAAPGTASKVQLAEDNPERDCEAGVSPHAHQSRRGRVAGSAETRGTFLIFLSDGERGRGFPDGTRPWTGWIGPVSTIRVWFVWV